ncbi:MAG: beta-galactosidase GalA [Flavisolibacter sp.]
MRKTTSLFFLISLVFFNATIAQQSNVRNREMFDDDWKFHFGHAADPTKDFNYGVSTIFSKSGAARGTAIDPRFDDKSWRSLNLPHDWAVEVPFVNVKSFDVMAHGYRAVGGLFPETSIGWYRKHFSIARQDSGRRYELQFDGVFRDATVWINGFYLGNNKSGYIGMSYDITDFLNYDRENVIVVRVDATQYEGWFYEGAGIYRHVWLNSYNNLHIAHDGVFVHAAVNKNKTATVTIETTVENNKLLNDGCEVYSYITDRNGKKIVSSAARPISLLVNGKMTITQNLNLSSPRLWSLDDPYLYRAVSVVKQKGKIIDSITQRFGVRSFRFDATEGFFLNEKHVKITGTNNHQDHAGVGSALPDYLQYYRVRLLKDMGANAMRTSHNAPTPALLDACDSLGMLVLDEQRLLNSGAEYMNQFERLIRRDRNHASIFIWSIGNEEGWIQTTSTGRRIAQTLLAKQKELDPTRTSTYAADVPNVFKGVNEVIPVRGFNYRDSAVADYHRDHPTQPIIGTEMGSTVTTRGIWEKDTVRAYVPDQDITAPWWASTAEKWWKPAAENAYWMGGFVWTGFDYRGEPTPYEWPNINSHFGIMDMCGFPKNIYYYYQSWWTDKDVLHISPHWNWKGKEGQPIDVWVNTNADEVELFLNGYSYGKKAMPRNSHLQWSIPYQPGTLEAIAMKKGKRLRAKVETTGEAVEIVVTPYKTTMLADGKDVSVINISAIDRQGREVPDADQLIHFTWTGDAKIIGVGNGDPSSHEPDKYETDSLWQRRLFNGKCQVILQSGHSASIVKFQASAEGLRTGSTDVHTIPSFTPGPVNRITKYEKKKIDKMIGADISFLPQLESRGMKFSDKGVQKDVIEILKDHGFNYVRLRIFNDPARDSGYSPKKGFCDLGHTLQMAKRVKAAGLKLLLDFHYSDYWADPGKQFKPAAWRGTTFNVLKDSVYEYTKNVVGKLKAQGTTPDMVQIGNEINHGMIWPEGHISNLDSLAELIQSGIKGVHAIDASVPIMLHTALGGQHDETVFFFDNMLARGIQFDVIGMSYYPKWHGTLDDLRNNLTDIAKRYDQDIIIVEYSQLKREVHDIVFGLPNNKGKGTAIWEPLNTWEKIFNEEGKSNDFIMIYDEMKKEFLAAMSDRR